MRQKLTGLMLALSLAVTLLGGTAQAAGTTLSVSVPEELPAVGESFTVEVRVTDNPGLCAAQFTLAFDPAVVDCQSARVGPVLSGTMSAVNPDAPEGAILAAASVEPVEQDGVLGTFTFKVLQSGEAGFTLKDGVFCDSAGNEVSTNVTTAATPSQKTETPETSTVPEAPKDPEDPETPKKPEVPEAETQETPTLFETPRFSDVPVSFWSYAQIERAAELGLVGGYADGTFRPNASVTRGQFVTMLWRLAGRPEAAAEAPFADTAGLNADFRSAIAWAAEQGIVNGVTATEFRPGAAINRQQAMAILFRYSGGISGMELMLTELYDQQFRDSDSVAPALKPGVYWAVYNGIISGVTTDTLAPRSTATRAQIAVILMRYADQLSGLGTEEGGQA